MKAKKRDLMLHAVLLIYFEFIVILYQQEKYLLLGKLEFLCGDDWSFTFEKKNFMK